MSQRVLTDTYRSPLTKPSHHFPVFVRRQNNFRVYPTTINDYINAYYIAKPLPVVWGWVPGSRGQYLYDIQSSVDFELSSIEQTEVILKILAYAGIIIRDPQIIQSAQQMAAAEDINEKS